MAGKDADLRTFTNRGEGMRAEYEQACLVASDALAKHQNMSDIRNGMSKSDDQRPRATLMQPRRQHLITQVGNTRPTENSSRIP